MHPVSNTVNINHPPTQSHSVQFASPFQLLSTLTFYFDFFSQHIVSFVLDMSSAATISDTRNAIDSALAAKGAPFNEYSCKTVSWDDVSRGTVGGSLSTIGANITDTYLKGKNGESLFTVRPCNWNEKLGVVRAEDVALLIGNCDTNQSTDLKNITLRQFLERPYENGGDYVPLKEDLSLSCEELDNKVSIRFQTVFLPIDENISTFQFAAEAYNYNTLDDKNPRNLVLLATSQGLSIQADGKGAKRLLLHVRENGEIYETWLEAEKSKHGVGGAQVESEEERANALARGKAVSRVLGLKAMGTRFNALITIQVPLEQSQEHYRSQYQQCCSIPLLSPLGPIVQYRMPLQLNAPVASTGVGTNNIVQVQTIDEARLVDYKIKTKSIKRMRGVSNAARVSRGEKHGVLQRLTVDEVKRNRHEHITVTVVFYNTVAGGVPSEEDVVAAINDIEQLYEACTEQGRLADSAFDFMKKELKVKDIVDVVNKVVTQPPSH